MGHWSPDHRNVPKAIVAARGRVPEAQIAAEDPDPTVRVRPVPGLAGHDRTRVAPAVPVPKAADRARASPEKDDAGSKAAAQAPPLRDPAPEATVPGAPRRIRQPSHDLTTQGLIMQGLTTQGLITKGPSARGAPPRHAAERPEPSRPPRSSGCRPARFTARAFWPLCRPSNSRWPNS